MDDNGRASKTTKILATVMIILAILVFGVLVVLLFCCPGCNPPTPPNGFGDDILGGTLNADALAITPDGYYVGEGIEGTADPPTIVFGDDFETDLSAWDTVEDVSVTTDQSYFGSQSAFFDNSIDNNAILEKSVSINVDADETIETYFFVLVNSSWDAGDNDYFVMKIDFDGDKALIYELVGDFSTSNSSEAIIDISTQVTATGVWVGINVQQIDNDYLVQFGSMTLPIPDITLISFIVDSDETDENVYLDEIEVKVTPKPFSGDGFWKKIPSNEKVTSYFVEAEYEITTSGDIDTSSVHAEIKLWVTIYSDSGKTTEVLAKTLIQDDLISPATPNSIQLWASKVFLLPDDDTVFGDELYYEFSIRIEVWGELLSSPGDFVYANDEAEGFDTLGFQWVAVEGSIDVIIYVLSGLGVAGGFGAYIIAKKKRGKNDSGLSAKESLFN